MDRISKIAINDSADLHMQRFVHVIAYCAWFGIKISLKLEFQPVLQPIPKLQE